MYRWETRILYSQLAADGRLSLSGLLNLFQDIATLHAEEEGDGLDALYAKNRAWLLSRWRVRLGDLPRSAQKVAVLTRAYETRLALNRRAFTLVDDQGRELAAADSLWTLVDTATGAPANAAQVVAPYFTPGEAPIWAICPARWCCPGTLCPPRPSPLPTICWTPTIT